MILHGSTIAQMYFVTSSSITKSQDAIFASCGLWTHYHVWSFITQRGLGGGGERNFQNYIIDKSLKSKVSTLKFYFDVSSAC